MDKTKFSTFELKLNVQVSKQFSFVIDAQVFSAWPKVGVH